MQSVQTACLMLLAQTSVLETAENPTENREANLFVGVEMCGIAFVETGSLCGPGQPRIYYVNEAGPELKDPPISASQVVKLPVCTTTRNALILTTKALRF